MYTIATASEARYDRTMSAARAVRNRLILTVAVLGLGELSACKSEPRAFGEGAAGPSAGDDEPEPGSQAAGDPDASSSLDDSSGNSPNSTSGSGDCAADQHSCPERGCVSNNAPDTCGVSCTPCEAPMGGLVACDGTRCVPFCPDELELCAGLCLAAEEPCNAACPDGTRDCGGICVTTDDPNYCGDACEPCPVPDGATAVICEQGVCGFTCEASAHRCGETCVANDDATACGSECAVCPTDPNGETTCDDGSCTLNCRSGYHECAGHCVTDDDVEQCGAACLPCSAPEGGSVECANGRCSASCPEGTQLCAGNCIASGASCDGSCPSGTHDCAGNCLPDDSPGSCGSSCTPCPDGDPNGTAVCVAGSCEVQCSDGFHACDGTCVSNGGVEHCGRTSCEPCPVPEGGDAFCNGNNCQMTCPAYYQVCDGACLYRDYNCNGVCTGNDRACGEYCFLGINASDRDDSCDPLVWRSGSSGSRYDSSGSSLREETLDNDSPFAITGLVVSFEPGEMAGCDPSIAYWEVIESSCTDTLDGRSACSWRVRFNAANLAPGCYAVSLEASSSGDAFATTTLWAEL